MNIRINAAALTKNALTQTASKAAKPLKNAGAQKTSSESIKRAAAVRKIKKLKKIFFSLRIHYLLPEDSPKNGLSCNFFAIHRKMLCGQFLLY